MRPSAEEGDDSLCTNTTPEGTSSSSTSPTACEDLSAPFVSVLQRCSAAAPHAVRQLSARALAPLIAPNNLIATLASLLSPLPGSTTSAAAVATQSNVQQQQEQQLGPNAIHGILLQVTVLLRVNATALPEQASRQAAGKLAATALLSALPHVFKQTHTLSAASSPLYGSAVAAACLVAAEAALELLPAHNSEAMALLTAVQTCCHTTITATLEAIDSVDVAQRKGVVVLGTDFPDPMRCVLMKTVARLWLGPALARQAVSLNSADVATWLASEMTDRLQVR